MLIRSVAFVAAVALLSCVAVRADEAGDIRSGVTAALANRCQLMTAHKFDMYTNTMTPDFTETTVGGKPLSREDYVKFQTADTRQNRSIECVVVIRAIYLTPTGASAHYLEAQTHTGGSVPLRTETNTAADFVRGGDGGWLLTHLTALGVTILVGTSHGSKLGSMDAAPAPPGAGPNLVPPPVSPSVAAATAQIALSDCVGNDRTPSVGLTFTNLAQEPITRLRFAVFLNGQLLFSPIAAGTFSSGVKIDRDFVLPRDFSGEHFLARPVCYVQSLTRADGTSWTNPDPSLALAPPTGPGSAAIWLSF
jgi:hypothetical protein